MRAVKEACDGNGEDMCIDAHMALIDAKVLSNEYVAPEVHLMRLDAQDVACSVEPGQFVHMAIPGMEAHILRRPFSVYAVDRAHGVIDILYRTVGFGSAHLSGRAPGDACSLIGPIGHGWGIPDDARRILLVGGGLGAAPLYMLCEQGMQRGLDVEVVLGATTQKLHVCRERYAQVLGREPICATDDGSFGYPGFATKPVEALLLGSECAAGPALTRGAFDYVAVCGPLPLMRAVASTAQHAQVPCEVSLEKRMACGIGACLSCVVDTVDGKRRACVDGPVFDARDIMW